MITIERLLFGLLIVSPIISVIAFIAKSNSAKQNPDNNDAYYYSFWILLFAVGILFNVFSFTVAQNGDIPKGLLLGWKLLVGMNPVIYLGFVIGCLWGYSTLNTNMKYKTADEVADFILKVFGSTIISVGCYYLFQIIFPIVNQVN